MSIGKTEVILRLMSCYINFNIEDAEFFQENMIQNASISTKPAASLILFLMLIGTKKNSI